MAKWTKTSADIEKFAGVHHQIGDIYPSPTLRIKTKDGKTYSGLAVGFHLSRNHYSGAYHGVVTLHVGIGNQIVEIEYLDVDQVERISN